MSGNLLVSIKKSIKAAILSKILGVISQAVVFLAFTQTLTIEQYGYLMLIISSAGWLTIGAGGIYSLIARNVSIDSSWDNIILLVRRYIKIIIMLSLIPLLLIGVAMLFAQSDKLLEFHLVKRIFEWEEGGAVHLILYLILMNILISVFSVAESVNLGMQRNHVNYLYNIYQNIIVLVLLILVLIEPPLLVYLIILTLPMLLSKALNFYYLLKRNGSARRCLLEHHASTAFSLTNKNRELLLFIFMGLCGYVSQGGLISVASYSFTDTELGIFSIYVRISSIIGMMLLVYTQPMGATLGLNWEKLDFKKVRYLIKVAYILVIVISALVFILFLLTNYLISVGFAYLPRSLVIMVNDGHLFTFWLLFFIFQMFNNVNCISFIYMKKTMLPALISLAELMVVLTIFLVIRPDYVSQYYFYSSIILYFLVLFPSMYVLQKFTNFKEPSSDLPKSQN